MEAIDQSNSAHPITLIWLVALGLFNSVVSAFYYVRVLKAMFLREPGERRLAPAGRPIYLPIVVGTLVVVIFGLMPEWLLGPMQAASVPMLTTPIKVQDLQAPPPKPGARAPAPPSAGGGSNYGEMMKKAAQSAQSANLGAAATKKGQPQATKKAGGAPAAKAKARRRGCAGRFTHADTTGQVECLDSHEG